MGWMACVSLIVKLQTMVIPLDSYMSVRLVVGIIESSLVQGTGSVLTLLLLFHWARGAQWPFRHPGHWVVVVYGVVTIVNAVVHLTALYLAGSPDEIVELRFITIGYMLPSLAAGVIFAVLAFAMPTTGLWRWCLATWAIAFLFAMLEHVSHWFDTPTNALMSLGFLLLLLTVKREYGSTSVQRDWVHWMGVGILVFASVRTLGEWLFESAIRGSGGIG